MSDSMLSPAFLSADMQAQKAMWQKTSKVTALREDRCLWVAVSLITAEVRCKTKTDT